MNFLPGPVNMASDVLSALASVSVNHRSAEFRDILDRVKARLRRMTGAAEVALLFGSGTLANDAVAAQLRGKGLVLSNGEFGERLVGHCKGAGLNFDVTRSKWGEPLSDAISAEGYAWIWAVHCETSTGVLNDLSKLKALARLVGAKLVLDCVSSLGAVDVDFAGVHLASSVSGKALGAPSGVAIVLADEPVNHPAPPYLGLGRYWRDTPYTFNAGILKALERALASPPPQRGDNKARETLVAAGFDVVGDGSAPHVITLRVPDSVAFGSAMGRSGFRIAFESSYLVERNWVQVCLMGHRREEEIDALISAMVAARAEC